MCKRQRIQGFEGPSERLEGKGLFGFIGLPEFLGFTADDGGFFPGCWMLGVG